MAQKPIFKSGKKAKKEAPAPKRLSARAAKTKKGAVSGLVSMAAAERGWAGPVAGATSARRSGRKPLLGGLVKRRAFA